MLLFDSALRGHWALFGEAASYIVLPAIVLSLPCMASILRVNRAEMVEALRMDYVVAARSDSAPIRQDAS